MQIGEGTREIRKIDRGYLKESIFIIATDKAERLKKI